MLEHRHQYLSTGHVHEPVEDILKGYVASVVDLSIHEISVFTLQHSCPLIDRIYTRLHEKFLQYTKDLFLSIDPHRWGLKLIEPFMSLDLQLVSKIFLKMTVKEYISLVCSIQISLLKRTNLATHSQDKDNGQLEFKGHKSSTQTSSAENVNMNLVFRNSCFEGNAQSKNTTTFGCNEFRDALLDKLVYHQIDSSDEEEEVQIGKNLSSNSNSLKKTHSVRENPLSRYHSNATDLYSSGSLHASMSELSSASELKEILNKLVQFVYEGNFQSKLQRQVSYER